jgi:hypothetical protein
MFHKSSFRKFSTLSFVLIFSFYFSSVALAIQPSLVEIKPEADGTYTYVYKIKIDNNVQVKGGSQVPDPDFFTIFNFAGLVAGSAKQPAGWSFSTSTNGVTPFRGGRTVLHPVDIDGIPNLTWSRVGPDLTSSSEITGFSVRTTVKETMVGEYGSQVTHKNEETNNPKLSIAELKEARIGSVTTPKLAVRSDVADRGRY